jgi:hypothetical protein
MSNQNVDIRQASPEINFNKVGGLFDWVDKEVKLIQPRMVIIILVVCGMLYFVVSTLGGGGSDGGGDAITANASVIEILLWAIFIVIVLLNGFHYFFNTNITTEISNIFSTTPHITLSDEIPEPTASGSLGTAPGSKMRKQVFHIPASIYDYDNAKAVCQAYGANLANIDQMEEAHKSGAEWCSYGWSDNQMILYPTQKSTWDDLQKSGDTTKKNSCGRPGINGGFMDNPSLKAGVNCYGVKPEMNEPSSKLMAGIQNYEAGKMIDPLHEARINEMKSKVNDLVVAPFNKSAWSLL